MHLLSTKARFLLPPFKAFSDGTLLLDSNIAGAPADRKTPPRLKNQIIIRRHLDSPVGV